MTTRLALTLIAALVLPSAGVAQSHNCGPREHVIDQLAMTYGERYSGGGLQNDTAVFEVWISDADGTWTILMTHPDGQSCIMAAGTDWLPALPRHHVAGIPS
ncbi:hypothetical protein [uncultured Jannaschia sp.]|uniref:hypothetical protein n=1 Tax=uncultured Jannaschia sp. TaxID=293347 RepID=UPI002627F15A|nr:hypothetical protein [uncultured Jannaschia sp.]